MLRLDDRMAYVAPLQGQECGTVACELPVGAGKFGKVLLPAAGYYRMLVAAPGPDPAPVVVRVYPNGSTPAAADLDLPKPGAAPAPLSVFRARDAGRHATLYVDDENRQVAVRMLSGTDTVLYLSRVF